MSDDQPGYTGQPQPGEPQPPYTQPAYGQSAYPPSAYAQPGYAQPGYAQPGYAQPGYAQPGYGLGYSPVAYASPSSRTVAALLAFFFGVLGVHRFYVGKVGTGILQLVTGGGLGIWTLVDFVVILVGGFRDKDGLPLTNW